MGAQDDECDATSRLVLGRSRAIFLSCGEGVERVKLLENLDIHGLDSPMVAVKACSNQAKQEHDIHARLPVITDSDPCIAGLMELSLEL